MCSGFLGLLLCGRGRRWAKRLSPIRRYILLFRGIEERSFLSIVRLTKLEVALIDLMEASVFGDILRPLIQSISEPNSLGRDKPAKTLCKANLQRDVQLRVVGLAELSQVCISNRIVDLSAGDLCDEVFRTNGVGCNLMHKDLTSKLLLKALDTLLSA